LTLFVFSCYVTVMWLSNNVFRKWSIIFWSALFLLRMHYSVKQKIVFHFVCCYYHFNSVAKYFSPASISVIMSVVRTGEVWYPRLLLGPISNSLINNAMKKKSCLRSNYRMAVEATVATVLYRPCRMHLDHNGGELWAVERWRIYC